MTSSHRNHGHCFRGSGLEMRRWDLSGSGMGSATHNSSSKTVQFLKPHNAAFMVWSRMNSQQTIILCFAIISCMFTYIRNSFHARVTKCTLFFLNHFRHWKFVYFEAMKGKVMTWFYLLQAVCSSVTPLRHQILGILTILMTFLANNCTQWW